MIIKQLKKRFKSYLIAIVFLIILQVIFVSVVLVFLAKGYNITSPEESGEKSGFEKILKDSISKYGVDFTSGLTIFLAERFDFEDYVEFTYTRDEVVKKVDEDDGLKGVRDTYKSLYGGIVKEKDDTTYYDWYFPIASGYKVSYTNDFGNPRPNEREHIGNDLMCNEGTPIICVESGTITNMGWNNLGGWRIGITSTSGERYWYYAHMRKIHPYVKSLKKGSKVTGGQVIGYVGSTGYSDAVTNETLPESSNAVDNKFEKHLHIGVYRIIGGENVPFNPFPVLKVLEANKISVKKNEDEYISNEKSIQQRSIKLFFSIDNDSGIGFLSEKYESNGDPGVVADNKGDIGGKSYGAFQFASEMGTVYDFILWLKDFDMELHERLLSAKNIDGYGDLFDSEWKQIAREYPQHFFDLQYSYIKGAYFDPLVSYFKNNGLDIENRSKTLQAVIWSTAVQHGVGGAIGIIEIQNLKGTDREIIIGIYNERMKVGIHFASSSQSIKQSVYDRFVNELEDALSSLESEGG